MQPLSGPRVFGWKNDWVKITNELAQERRAWGASIRDVVNSIGDTGSNAFTQSLGLRTHSQLTRSYVPPHFAIGKVTKTPSLSFSGRVTLNSQPAGRVRLRWIMSAVSPSI